MRAQIEAANQSFMQAVKRADEEQFVSLYTDDAVLLLPGREPVTGPSGVRTFFASFKTRGVCEVRLNTLEVEGFEDTAWERGSAELKGVDGAVMGLAKYIVIWKLTPQGWKIHRDIMNSSTP